MHSHPSSPTTAVNIRRRIFEFIIQQEAQLKCLPSRDELRQLFTGLTEDLDLHLEQLAREGLIILDKDGSNGISLVPTYTPAPQIELLGRMSQRLKQGNPSSYAGSIALDLQGAGVSLEPGMVAVQVLDDRMSDAGIEHGDIALLVNTSPMRGDIVAVEEGEVLVLRRYIVVSGIPHFLAENPSTPDLRPGWESPLYGVLWGLIRADIRRSKQSARTTKARITYAHGATISTSSNTQGPAKTNDALSPDATRPRKRGNWPKAPSGVELNEAESSYRFTEDLGAYDTWGPIYPVVEAVNCHTEQP